jgi:hypothetical protein
VLPTWDIAAYKADTSLSMRKALTDLVTVFNSMAHDWHDGGCEFLSVLDNLAQFKFPEILKGQLEMTDCISNTVLEKINVLGCVSGNNMMSCELEIGVPTKFAKVTEMTLLNYQGIQLALGKDTKLVRDEGSGYLKLAHYGETVSWDSEEVPMCKLTDLPEPCSKALESENLDAIINDCKFERVPPVPVLRLHDEGILVMAPNAKIREDTRVLYQSIPIVIYSNNLITVTIDGEEMTFPPLVPIKYSQILTTRLFRIQINALIEKVDTAEYWENFGRETYMDYLLLALQAVFGPLAVGGLGFTCYIKRKTRFQVPTVYERTVQRRSNMVENLALLNRTN